MRTTVVTGSAGGMGSAIRSYLEAKGEKVIGVDTRGAEVIADLSNREGRAAMIEEVGDLCGGIIDGVVAAAGVCHNVPGSLISSVNYFGAIATLEGLRPMLARGDAPRAVAVCSNSMVVVPVYRQLLDAYAAEEELAAREFSDVLRSEEEADEERGTGVYATSKYALARWLRAQAVKPEWIGSGISLNAIAPGVIDTQMAPPEDQEVILGLGDIYPVPAGRAGTPEEIANLVGFLLSEGTGFINGSVIYIDGGTEAAMFNTTSPLAREVI